MFVPCLVLFCSLGSVAGITAQADMLDKVVGLFDQQADPTTPRKNLQKLDDLLKVRNNDKVLNNSFAASERQRI